MTPLLVGVLLATSQPSHERRLLDLLRQRLLISRSVAKAKFNRHSPVEDLPREKAVIDQAVRLAKSDHVDETLTRAVFGAQIEASKMVQRGLIRKWSGHPPFHPAPDLAKEIRPKLDRLTKEIVAELAKTRVIHKLPNVVWPAGESEIFKPAWLAAVHPLTANR